MELVFVTLILGAFVLLAFYIGRIFKSEVQEEIIETADVTEKEAAPAVVASAATAKSKKKPEKKVKEKDNFKHPWLLTSLKVGSCRADNTSIIQ